MLKKSVKYFFNVFSIWGSVRGQFVLLVSQHGALLPSCGYRQYYKGMEVRQWRYKLLQSVGELTVRVSLSSLSGAVLTNTDVIIPTISGEGTVFSAITCGFSKYRAWWEQKETVIRQEKTMASYSVVPVKTNQKQTHYTESKATGCGGRTYNNFRKVFVNLLHKVQKVMNLWWEENMLIQELKKIFLFFLIKNEKKTINNNKHNSGNY